MKPNSSKLSLYAILLLIVTTLIVGIVSYRELKLTASAERENLSTVSIPFKLGENELSLTRSIDLSGRIIGLNGSLITLEEAKRRGVIEGVYTKDGKELGSLNLLSPGSSFIIKAKDITASPALFY